MVRQLGSDSFKEFEAVQQRLVAIGSPARKSLLEASRSDNKEVARRAAVVLEEIRKQGLARAEVHVVGLYECRGKKALVEVNQTKKPVILVLCAYEGVTWSVQTAEGADVVQVIASGYHKQSVEGIDAPLLSYSYDERTEAADGNSFYFYTYDHDEDHYQNMVSKVRQLTGKRVTSFQGRYSFKKVPFIVGTTE